MKEIVLHIPKKSAKQFLLELVPKLLQACKIPSQQRIFGFNIDLVQEANKRMQNMNEEDAEATLNTLVEELKKYG